MNLDIISFPNEIEKFIYNHINLKPVESYKTLSESELDELYNKVLNEYPNNKNQIKKEIIKSIKASKIRMHMLKQHPKLIKQTDKIIKDYNNGMNIITLSKKYDYSPLNILRQIFSKKYNKKLTKIFKNKEVLSSRDRTELENAIKNDSYALIDNDKILKESIEFEEIIEKFLKKNKISYKTQNDLIKEQIKSHNSPVNTPDFLITSDLEINNQKIKWIDAKNFYGAKDNFLIKKIKKQTSKYISEFGEGAIIFSLGFNSNLNFKKILLIDYESIEKL
jgi:hypothetical protein